MGVPTAAGIGLRTQHMTALAAGDVSAPAWVEIHSENFLCDGGPRLSMLNAVAARMAVSCHGVGLSLGSADGLDREHLARLKLLFARVRPGLISEHLAWSVSEGVYLNDLLPLPMTESALETVCRNVAQAQEFFGRRLLIENPSTYVRFTDADMSEVDFLALLVERTGCGLLLDINNVYVSAANNGFDAGAYLRDFPLAAVGEIHLAGHTVTGDGDTRLLIDTHSAQVCDAVWDLYAEVIARSGAVPTLIEWDHALPTLPVLMNEAAIAQRILDRAGQHIKDRAYVA